MPLLKKFLELSTPEKCRILYLEGEFIMAVRYYKYKVNLYRLGNMMIEIFYSHKLDKIHKIQLLDSTSSRMNFYANQVSLNELFLTHKNLNKL